MRERTLGNSTRKLYNQICEQHSEACLHRMLQFLNAREPFHVQAAKGLFTLDKPQPMPPVPKSNWFLAVYLRDVIARIDQTKAKITSTFGSILKNDSTKKV